MNIKQRIKTKLFETSNLQPNQIKNGYCHQIRHNLSPFIDFSLIQTDYQKGNGNELKQKIKALHSSSALVINSFGFYKQAQIVFEYQLQRYPIIKFEAKCPTGVKGSPPNLDILFENSNHCIGIESKFTEYLKQKTNTFTNTYKNHKFIQAEKLWLSQIENYDDQKTYFDVAQIIKHYLGLSNTYRNKKITILYLYWEPLDWQNYSIFNQHRIEIDQFSQKIKSSKVNFQSISYNDLWASWQNYPHLSKHLDYLKNRYQFSLK